MYFLIATDLWCDNVLKTVQKSNILSYIAPELPHCYDIKLFLGMFI